MKQKLLKKKREVGVSKNKQATHRIEKEIKQLTVYVGIGAKYEKNLKVLSYGVEQGRIYRNTWNTYRVGCNLP